MDDRPEDDDEEVEPSTSYTHLIRAERLRRGLTLVQFAELCGVDPRDVSAAELDLANPEFSIAVAEELGIRDVRPTSLGPACPFIMGQLWKMVLRISHREFSFESYPQRSLGELKWRQKIAAEYEMAMRIAEELNEGPFDLYVPPTIFTGVDDPATVAEEIASRIYSMADRARRGELSDAESKCFEDLVSRVRRTVEMPETFVEEGREKPIGRELRARFQIVDAFDKFVTCITDPFGKKAKGVAESMAEWVVPLFVSRVRNADVEAGDRLDTPANRELVARVLLEESRRSSSEPRWKRLNDVCAAAGVGAKTEDTLKRGFHRVRREVEAWRSLVRPAETSEPDPQ